MGLRRGAPRFTLLELLVVIAVVASLASLLLPALDRARGGARDAQCRGQLHQVGVALELYRAENGDWFPFGWWQGSVTAPVGHANYPTWDWLLLGGYLNGERRVFRCPADPLLYERSYSYNAVSNERIWGVWRFQPPWCNDGCATPCWRQTPADATRPQYGLDTFTGAAIEHPDETVAIRELHSQWVYQYASGAPQNWQLGQLGHWWHSIHHYVMSPCDNHAGGANYLMADAHVQRLTAAEMPGGDWLRTGWWYARRKF